MLAWSLLNTFLFLAFLYAWVMGVKFLWRSKPWLALLFVLGTLGFRSRHENSLRASAKSQTSAFGSVNLLEPKPSTVRTGAQVLQVIHESISQSLTLTAFYSRDSTGLHLVTGTTSLSGFVSGFIWVPGPIYLTDGASGKTVHYYTY